MLLCADSVVLSAVYALTLQAMLVASIRNSTAGSARVADDVLSTSETPQGPMTRRAQVTQYYGRTFTRETCPWTFLSLAFWLQRVENTVHP